MPVNTVGKEERLRDKGPGEHVIGEVTGLGQHRQIHGKSTDQADNAKWDVACYKPLEPDLTQSGGAKTATP